MIRTKHSWMWATPMLAFLSCARCTPEEPNMLDAMPTDTVRINDHEFRVWIADDPQEVTQGLMFVTKEQMSPLPDGTDRGMLFLFDYDRTTGFWMRNTIIPLDIAFIGADGAIVTIHTMAPLVEQSYWPDGPYRYALEVNANLFSEYGIRKGDQVQIPESVLKKAR